MERLKHVALLYTYNRPELIGRSIRCWLEQTYKETTLCIFNNSSSFISLPNYIYEESNNRIHLVNQSKSCTNQEPYTNLGEIYNDGLFLFNKEIAESDVVSLWQDDDIYLSNHLEGCNYFENEIYKPFYSIYSDKANKKSSLEQNTFEGSWFINTNFLIKHGFDEPHNYPEGKLIRCSSNGIIAKKELPPTYIYEWNNGVHHMSGGYSNHNTAFINHRANNIAPNEEKVIDVWSKEKLMDYYKDNNLLQWIQ